MRGITESCKQSKIGYNTDLVRVHLEIRCISRVKGLSLED